MPLNSNLDRADLAGSVMLGAGVNCLPSDSVAVLFGLELLEGTRLGERAGRLPQGSGRCHRRRTVGRPGSVTIGRKPRDSADDVSLGLTNA